MTQPELRLHRFALSGHCHRVELLLSLLRLPYTKVEVDLAGGEHKRPAFLAKNPFGQVPVLEDGALCLADSNAILVYLAGRYDQSGRWLPREPRAAAEVQRWLSVAAGPLAHGPASARLVKLFGAALDLERAQQGAAELFRVLEAHLGARPFLTGEAPTIADLAIYAYVALAPEGGISLEPYAQLRRWLSRVEALPGFVPMQRSVSHG